MRRFCLALLFIAAVAIHSAAIDPSCDDDWKPKVEKLRQMSPEDLVRLKESAMAGDPEAQLQWGRTFGFAIGKPENLVTAREWYVKAAEAGNCSAQKILAEWAMTGKGGNTDPKEAYKWNLKLAERGL